MRCRTADGREIVPWQRMGRATLWLPSPPRHGDPIRCEGRVVGEVHGDLTTPGGGCMILAPTSEMPESLASYVRSRREQYEERPEGHDR